MKNVLFIFIFVSVQAYAINSDVRRLKNRDSHLIFDDKLNANEIVVTFSGKINPKTLPQILKKLSDEGIRAHFFLNGDSATEYPDLVLDVAAQNHVIGSQGLSKAAAAQLGNSTQSTLNEIQTGHEAVFASAGFVYPFIRLSPRQGSIAVRDLIKESGAFAFYWNIDYYPENPALSIRENLKREDYRGIVAISLFREDALPALDALIDEIKEHDLTVITILPSEESTWLENPPLVKKQLREEIYKNGSLYKRKHSNDLRWL